MSALERMLDHVHRLTSNSGEPWVSTIELMLADEIEAKAEFAALRADRDKLIRVANIRSDLDCSYAGIDLAEASLAHHCPIDKPCSRYGYEKQIDALRAEVEDWRNSAKMAASQTCGDEKHCTCVGPLRSRVAALEKAIEAGDAVASTVASHDTESLSCDRDGNDYCECLSDRVSAYHSAREACR